MELKNFLLQNVRIVTPVYNEGNFWDLNSQNIFRKFQKTQMIGAKQTNPNKTKKVK